MSPATVDDVVRPVGVPEHVLVDRLGAVMEARDQRPAEMILERPFGSAGPRHADAAELVVALDVVGAEEQVVPAVFFHDRRRPERTVRPGHVAKLQDARVLFPADEVAGGERVHVQLLVVRGGIRGVDPVPPFEDVGLGIGVPTGKDRIAGSRGLCSEGRRRECGQR
jgi:hypothetical protein